MQPGKGQAKDAETRGAGRGRMWAEPPRLPPSGRAPPKTPPLQSLAVASNNVSWVVGLHLKARPDAPWAQTASLNLSGVPAAGEGRGCFASGSGPADVSDASAAK